MKTKMNKLTKKVKETLENTKTINKIGEKIMNIKMNKTKIAVGVLAASVAAGATCAAVAVTTTSIATATAIGTGIMVGAGAAAGFAAAIPAAAAAVATPVAGLVAHSSGGAIVSGAAGYVAGTFVPAVGTVTGFISSAWSATGVVGAFTALEFGTYAGMAAGAAGSGLTSAATKVGTAAIWVFGGSTTPAWVAPVAITAAVVGTAAVGYMAYRHYSKVEVTVV